MAYSGPHIILASESPRRRKLLKEFSFPYDCVVSGVSEVVPAHYSPRRTTLHLAQLKAQAAASKLGGEEALVLGCDTVIDLDGQTLGKPQDVDDARKMLMRLRDRSHAVITGVAVLRHPSGHLASCAVTSTVRMRAFSSSELEDYLLSGEPMDKAGSYAIQGLGAKLVDGLEGCYSSIVGLPLCLTGRLLREASPTLADGPPVCSGPDDPCCPRNISQFL